MNELAINPDALAINPEEAEGSLLWLLFDDILVLFWEGYFMYNREIMLKSHGTSLVTKIQSHGNKDSVTWVIHKNPI